MPLKTMPREQAAAALAPLVEHLPAELSQKMSGAAALSPEEQKTLVLSLNAAREKAAPAVEARVAQALHETEAAADPAVLAGLASQVRALSFYGPAVQKNYEQLSGRMHELTLKNAKANARALLEGLRKPEELGLPGAKAPRVGATGLLPPSLTPSDSRAWGLENVPDSRYSEDLKRAAEALAARSPLELRRAQKTPGLDGLFSRIWGFDPKLYYHMVRVGLMAADLALAMGMPKAYAQDLAWAARLHDVGKMDTAVHEVISKPGRLTPEERALMESHPEIGAGALAEQSRKPGRVWRMAGVVARSHHEAFDGSGYPDKLRGKDIPLEARITTVADVFDALMENRPYRPGLRIEDALAVMEKERGRYDPKVYAALLKVLGRRPAPPKAEFSAAPSLWSRFLAWVRRADLSPPYPGQPGDQLRVAGRTYTLGRKLYEDSVSTAYQAEGNRDAAVRLFKDPAAFESERAGLQDLAKAGLPHNRLLAASAEQPVLVQETVDDPALDKVLASGGPAEHQLEALADLAALLLGSGLKADLSPAKLQWHRWRSEWRLLEGRSLRPGKAGEVLPFFLGLPGADHAAFLSAVRGRLGPDSAAWRSVPKNLLAPLERADAARAPAPVLKFKPGRLDPALDDSWVSAAELKKRLGYDPFTQKEKRLLHTDDPGKLNTRILEVRAQGHAPGVLKSASSEIIQNEVFLRKAARRWFGRYFDTPRALAVSEGGEATMFMERVNGERSYTGKGMSVAQRVALGLLVHTFGVGDVNPGNLLYPARGLPSLIDFEQALGRHTPAHRIAHEGILEELPWVNGWDAPATEDFYPAIRAWRELLAKPETQADLARMMADSGLSAERARRALQTVNENAARLEWLVQSDVEFARQFIRRQAR